MKHLCTASVALAFAATTVSGSAQTSLTPGQSAKIYRTVIPQGRGRAPIVRERIVIKLVVPMPLPRKRIEDLPDTAQQRPAQDDAFLNDAFAVPDAPANTDTVPVVNDALAVPDVPANTDGVPVVNDALAVPDASTNPDKVPMAKGALAVPDAPANTDTVPAKFSPKNAADDELITIAHTFKMLTKDERRAIYEALKHQPAPIIGTKLPPGVELQPVPGEVAARVPQIRGYHYAVVKDRVLLVGTGRIVAGVFADSPVTEECRER
jgi:hypothetical protein